LLKGGVVKVDTMHGEREIKVHPGTQPGQLIDIPRSGMICGHQAVVNTKFPNADELKSRKEWEYLGIQWAADEADDYKDDETLMFEGIWRNLHGFKRRP
jgi:DnaJ-class molecular chaperone